MKKILYTIIISAIYISCSNGNKKNANTLFGEYVNENMRLILNEDSTGLKIDNGVEQKFKWHIYNDIIGIDILTDSCLHAFQYNYNVEYLTIDETTLKKQ